LTTTGDLYACESRTNFDTNINRQQRASLVANARRHALGLLHDHLLDQHLRLAVQVSRLGR
jgi:hypothetical protein